MTGQNLREGWRNHADIKRPTAALRALSTVEANEKWRPYPPLDLPTGAIFHFVTIRKPLWLSRSTVIYEPTTIPFVIRVPYLSTLFILPSLSLSLSPLLLYFSISYRAVPRGTEISLMPRRDLFHSFLPRAAHEHLSRIPVRYRSRDDARYKSRGLGAHRAELANLGSRANFGPRSTLHLPPNRFDKRNLRGEIRIKERLVRGR